MRQLRTVAAFLVLAVGIPIYSQAQTKTASPATSPVEMTISGPHYIRRGDALNFKVTLTNRSDKPVAVAPLMFGGGASAIWRVTDFGGRLLPPHLYDQLRGYCPVTGPVMGYMLTVLQPGASMDFSSAGDPSDEFAFPGKGVYKVTLTFKQTHALYIGISPERQANEKSGQYTPAEKLAIFKDQPRIEATSNVWQMYLGD